MKSDPLTTLAMHFALFSLLTIGGANTALPEIHRLVVEIQGWLTDQQFADLFAIAQVTPGPNVIIATLIGYQVAGIAGAAVATVAICGPTCIVTFCVTRVWDRFRDAPWRNAVQAGLVPVSIGLLAASALVLAQANNTSVAAFALTAISSAIGFFARVNPLWVFAAAAIMGAIGLF